MEHETFWTLLTDVAHWQFELFLIVIFDVIIGALIWPQVKKWLRHHKDDDDKLTELEERLKILEKEHGNS